MALGDIGMFLPAESQYGAPGAYDQLLRSEATKRADYLASMDQFYEQLTESRRTFDATMAYQVETRDLNLVLEREKLAVEKMSVEADIKLGQGQLKLGQDTLAANIKSQERAAALEEEKLDLTREEMKSDEEFLDEIMKESSRASSSVSRSGVNLTSGRNINWGGSGSQSSLGSEEDVLFYGSEGAISKEEYDKRRREED